MSIWFYQYGPNDDGNLVLFDGENTYWTEAMMPSSGYRLKKGLLWLHRHSCVNMVYIGELKNTALDKI